MTLSYRELLSSVACCVLALEPVVAADWWNAEWTQRKPITVNTAGEGAEVREPVGNAPVLVRLHQGNFPFGVAKDDGSDLRFVAADHKTVLSHQIERFDPLLNEAFVWVKVPEVKPGGTTTLWLYYGNRSAQPLAADLAKEALDGDFTGVYRFAANGAPPADSSRAGNTALTAATCTEGAMIGSGLRLDGKTAVELPDSPSLAWEQGGALTVSVWLKPAALSPSSVVLSRRDGQAALLLGLDNGVPFVEAGGKRSAATTVLAAGYWRHLAVTFGGGRMILYVDGQQALSVAAELPPLKGVTRIGGEGSGGFAGEIDELEISRVARSPAFIAFAAYSQSGDKGEKMLVTGENEQPSDMFSWLTKGHFGVIIKNLTVDGWVVIIILGVMAMISWWVMIVKNRYLNAVARANRLFLREWHKIATDMTRLDEEAGDGQVRRVGGEADQKTERNLRNSPIYRVYHIGVEEIQQRFAGKSGEAARMLSASSIPAIRASLDGGLVRETQRLNSMMVLLTIAISGGPFLGLLGTVIGVMITFAAIAEAGDVNVNSIAPGIAAALLATVAGLAVAIPSLFGYNWLLARVKAVTSDMHVFIDEFVTRMAELYCDRDNVGS